MLGTVNDGVFEAPSYKTVFPYLTTYLLIVAPVLLAEAVIVTVDVEIPATTLLVG